MLLVSGENERIGRWVAERIPHIRSVEALGSFQALGVVDATGKLVAGCIYHNWVPDYGTCDITFAADSPRWALQQGIATMLAVPFVQYGCQRVTCVTPAKNKRAQRLLVGLGFTQEGAHVGAFGRGNTALSFRMLTKDYRALIERFERGQKRRLAATSS